MTDREMLELAAKAAGLEVDRARQVKRDTLTDPETASLWIRQGSTAWNPIADSGVALELAAKLKLKILPDKYGGGCTVEPQLWDVPGVTVFHDGGMDVQMRRAITIAAANIGKAML